MKEFTSWKRLGRKTIYSSRHLNVYEDTVQVPNGNIIDDYSVVEFNDVVLSVCWQGKNWLYNIFACLGSARAIWRRQKIA